MTSPIKRPNHQAFLWVLTEPGQAVDLEEFHDWYNNEHVPLRMSSLPEFLTGARYVAIDGQQPTFSAFYNVSRMGLFQQPKYTDLRVHRSSRETSLLNRIGTLDRRTYEIIESDCQITDMAYSPLIVTIEFPALNEENTRLRKALETHSSCKGTQTCKVIDHSLIGTSDLKSFDSGKDRVSTWMIIFEFDDESYESIPLFKTWSKTYDPFIIRQWKLYRGWKNTTI